MKKLILAIVFLLLSSSPLYAADQTITFVWTPNTDVVEGYNIYASGTADGPWVLINDELIVETTYTHVYTEDVEGMRWFHCTASDGRNESLPSDVVDCMVDTIAPGAPVTLTLSSD